MSIISLLLAIVVIGFICWVIQSAPIPMNAWFKNVLVGVIAIAALFWIVGAFGFHTGVHLR